MEERYWSELLFAAVRGYSERIGKSICELSAEDEEEIVGFAQENGFKAYHFKKKDVLPRVHKVLGFLRSIYFENLLNSICWIITLFISNIYDYFTFEFIEGHKMVLLNDVIETVKPFGKT